MLSVPHRQPPVAHFTTDSWINDPNGLLYHKGVYHLFFQNNPSGPHWADMSWGHATSTDLVNWEQQPTAIAATDQEQVFSGSAVADTQNSSGLGRDGLIPLVAIYTGVSSAESRSPGLQAQCLAYSLDDGHTWTRYGGNPVLDIQSSYSRDPKVFWYGGRDGHWVMVIVMADEMRVAIFTSPNLIDWTLASGFGPQGATGGIWECPDLFPLIVEETGEQRWVLVVSLNPGGPAGGSGTQYFVGDFDGLSFQPEPGTSLSSDSPNWLDWGPDCYAGVTFNGLPDGRRTLIAWANNWDYAHQLPTAPWRSSMTLARDLSLTRMPDGRLRLRQTPVLPAPSDEIRILTVQVPRGSGPTEIRAAAPRCSAETVRIVVDPDEGTIRCDRGQTYGAELHPTFRQPVSAPLVSSLPTADVTLVVDRGIIEIFAEGGLTVLTQIVLSAEPLTDIHVRHLGTDEGEAG